MAIGWQSGSTGASKQSPSHLLEDAPLLDRDTTAGSGLEPHHRERPPRQRRLDERRRDELQRRHGAYDEISAGDQVAFLGQPEGNQWALLWLSDGHLTEVGWQLVGSWLADGEIGCHTCEYVAVSTTSAPPAASSAARLIEASESNSTRDESLACERM